jgi:hypothetical protein
VGFQVGYIAYLNGEERKIYWEGFYKTLWETDDLLKPMYNWNFNNYLDSKMGELEKIRDNAIINHSKEPKPLLALALVYIPSSEMTFKSPINNSNEPSILNLSPVYKPPNAALINQHSIFAHKKQPVEELTEEVLEDFVMVDTESDNFSSSQHKNSSKVKIQCGLL